MHYYALFTQNVKFIIVVEKEAIYHRLLQDGLTDALSCILIASCGIYPLLWAL